MTETEDDFETSLLGSVLEGAYRIERLIARSETGAVFEAFHLRLDKAVAVRVLAPELAAVPEAQERFRREALVASGIGHPHIVQVFDHSITPTGEPFLAMELLQGEDLGQRLARVGTLSAAGTVQIVKQVASALAATHAKDVVHRNLTPANIWLLYLAGERDFVKLLGFGVSKARSSHNRITVTSMALGTPNYLSPEQVLGKAEDVDAASDQWALACVAWHCLAGAAPFDSDTAAVLLKKIVQEAPPPLAARIPGVSPAMEHVLLRALSKNKLERYTDITAFSDALERAFNGFAIASPSAAPVAPKAVPSPSLDADDAGRRAAPATILDRAPATAPATILDGAPAAAPATILDHAPVPGPATILDRAPAPPTARLPDDWTPRRPAPPTALLPGSRAITPPTQTVTEHPPRSVAEAHSLGPRAPHAWLGQPRSRMILAAALATLGLASSFLLRSCACSSSVLVPPALPVDSAPAPPRAPSVLAPPAPQVMPEDPVVPTLAEPSERSQTTSTKPARAKQSSEGRSAAPKRVAPAEKTPRPRPQPKLIFDL